MISTAEMAISIGGSQIPQRARHITQADLHILTEKSNDLLEKDSSQMIQNALSRIYGGELASLQQPGADASATNLFLPLLTHIFDKRTLEKVECTVNGTLISEEATPIHTRSSFISKVLSEKNYPLTIARIDLKEFRNADFDVGNSNGVRPADVIINNTARAMREALKEVVSRNMTTPDLTYEVGRYGGDEMVIAFGGGGWTQQLQDEVMNTVFRNLAEKQGYYKDADGKIEAKPIQIKKNAEHDTQGRDERVEWIEVPADDFMYREYMQRGLILNNVDFAREREKYTNVQGLFKTNLYKKDFPPGSSTITYPKLIKTVNDKVDYLSKNHPEFAGYFNLAKTYDDQERFAKSKKPYYSSQSVGVVGKIRLPPPIITRQRVLLQIIENSIFDRLLGDMIYSRPHFIEHLGKREIGEMHVIDFKFLKEMNSAMTFADTDKTIKRLWKQINSAIPTEERKNVMISRFAGAIYIGVEKGKELSDTCKQQLGKITERKMGKDYSVPLGTATMKIEDSDIRKPHEIIEQLEAASEKSYYSRLITDITKEEEKSQNTFIEKMMSLDIKALTERPYQPLTKVELYALALRGPRKDARIAKLLETIRQNDKLKNNKNIDRLIYYLGGLVK